MKYWSNSVTRKEFDEQREFYQHMLDLKQIEVQNLREQIQELKHDRDFYREELFKLKGIGRAENSTTEPEKHFEPIGRVREPWPVVQRRLEKQDREAILKEANSHAQKVEEYWNNKNRRSEEAERELQELDEDAS